MLIADWGHMGRENRGRGTRHVPKICSQNSWIGPCLFWNISSFIFLVITPVTSVTRSLWSVWVAVHIKGTAYVDVGSAISLICTANRKPNVPWRGLHWLQNGRRLDTNISEGITVVERNLDNGLVSSELSMKAATVSMAGDYVCKASDEDNASVFVYVLDGKQSKDAVSRRLRSIERNPFVSFLRQEEFKNSSTEK